MPVVDDRLVARRGESGSVCDGYAASARAFRSRTAASSGSTRARSHGAADASGVSQCQVHTGYDNSAVPGVAATSSSATSPAIRWSR